MTVGTVFHKTYVDLQKWFLAIPLVLNSQEAISARKLAKKIGVNKNTACYMIARIRKAMTEELELLQKVVEVQILDREHPMPTTDLIFDDRESSQPELADQNIVNTLLMTTSVEWNRHQKPHHD